MNDLLKQMKTRLPELIVHMLKTANLDNPIWAVAVSVSSDAMQCLPPYLAVCTEAKVEQYLQENDLEALWIPDEYGLYLSLPCEGEDGELWVSINECLAEHEHAVEQKIMPILSRICRKLNETELSDGVTFGHQFFVFAVDSVGAISDHVRRDVPAGKLNVLMQKFGLSSEAVGLSPCPQTILDQEMRLLESFKVVVHVPKASTTHEVLSHAQRGIVESGLPILARSSKSTSAFSQLVLQIDSDKCQSLIDVIQRSISMCQLPEGTYIDYGPYLRWKPTRVDLGY